MFEKFNDIARSGRSVSLIFTMDPVEGTNEYTVKAKLNAGTFSEKNPNGYASRVLYDQQGTDVEGMMIRCLEQMEIPVHAFCVAMDGEESEINITIPKSPPDIKTDKRTQATVIPEKQTAEEKPVAAEKKTPVDTGKLQHDSFIKSMNDIFSNEASGIKQFEIAKQGIENYLKKAKGAQKKEAETLLSKFNAKIKFLQDDHQEEPTVEDEQIPPGFGNVADDTLPDRSMDLGPVDDDENF